MVDPNRKINRLTEDDISFLDECEELFGNRFTDDDEQFMAHCSKPLSEPPVVMNFSNVGGGSQGGHFAHNNSYRSGRFNENRLNYRGGHGGRNRNYNRRHNSFGHGRDSGEVGGGNRYRHNNRNYRNTSNRNDDQRSSSMNFRRDYGNFVPASSNDGGA